MDVLGHNREAWDGQVAVGNRWTVPIGPEVMARARQGDWSIVLTPTRPVPRERTAVPTAGRSSSSSPASSPHGR